MGPTEARPGCRNNHRRWAMDPNEVGDMVLEAIQNNRFWILTHPEEFLPLIEKRVAHIKRDHAHRL